MEMPIIKLKNFDGPFDLLLHLIKKNEMSITEIKIHEITKQYLEYIALMKELDLEITSEFIVMATTLIEIKSKSLLPKVKVEDETCEEDLQKILMEKLQEYKKFKKISAYLRERELSTGEVFTKKVEIIEVEVDNKLDDDYFKNITMLDLYKIYNNLMRIYGEKQNVNVMEKKISVDKYKITDKINFLMDKLSEKSVVRFSEFIPQCECKLEVVVTFMAMLELIKRSEIKVVQYENFGEIMMEKVIVNE
ncbi:segregation/condensation protein A [Clostridium perfringens]|nr:segregation/condensation protein A [Clostridium perfringens]